MLKISKQDSDNLLDFINAHNFFFVSGHKEPDGDAIASCLGVAAILDKLNKPYQLISAGPFKRKEVVKYGSLFSEEMQFLSEPERKMTGLIIVDCSEIERLGDIDGDFNGLETFVIDHHKTSGESGCPIPNSKSYIDPTSPACAMLVQMFYENIIGPIPKETAEILFFGFCTDSGFFRFLDAGEGSSAAIEAAARLVDYGANPRETYRLINSGKPLSTRKLLGLMLSKAETYLDGRLIITWETMAETKLYGQNGRDSDSLYQLLLSAEGVEAVVFLRQETDNSCTGGFRSVDKIDVSAIAAKFGGGGHKNAAGMSTEGKVETLIPAIVKEFARII